MTGNCGLSGTLNSTQFTFDISLWPGWTLTIVTDASEIVMLKLSPILMVNYTVLGVSKCDQIN